MHFQKPISCAFNISYLHFLHDFNANIIVHHLILISTSNQVQYEKKFHECSDHIYYLQFAAVKNHLQWMNAIQSRMQYSTALPL